MQTRILQFAIALTSIMAITALTIPAAEAGRYKLKCDGPYQIVNGDRLATPICQNRYIAKVARKYGYRVTGRQLGNNANKKVLICTNLAHDTRIRHNCGAYSITPSIGPGR